MGRAAVIVVCVALPLLLAVAWRWLPPHRAIAPVCAGLTLAACLCLPWVGAPLGVWLVPDPLGVHVAALASLAWLAASWLGGSAALPAAAGCLNLALLTGSPELTVVAAGAAAIFLGERPGVLPMAAACVGLAVFGLALLHPAEAAGGWATLPDALQQARGAPLGVGVVLTLLGSGGLCLLHPLRAALTGGALLPATAILAGPLGGVWLVVALRLRGVLDGNGHAIAPGGLLVGAGLALLVAGLLCIRRGRARFCAGATLGMAGAAVFGFGLGDAGGTAAGLLELTVGCFALVAAGSGGWAGTFGLAALAGVPPLGVFAAVYGLFGSALARSIPLAVLFGVLELALVTAALRRGERVGWPGAYARGWLGAAAACGCLAAGHRGVGAVSGAAIRSAPTVNCRPWPRLLLAAEDWAALDPADMALEALWADTASVYAVFTDPDGQPLLASVPTREGRYAALSPRFPAAAAPERMIRDLWGHVAEGAADHRPWLDHGQWGFTHPLAPRHGPPVTAAEPELRPVAEALMQVPFGPVSGRLEEPVHLRVGTDGVVAYSVEARLGYAHKGTLVLVRGKSPRAAARFVARLAADSTVAHGLAFARATEAALAVEPPVRAVILRGVMAETERIATHLADLAAACPHVTRLAWHREQLLRAAAAAFGHRMMMDGVVPGGIASDIDANGPAALLACLAALEADWTLLVRPVACVGEGIGRLPDGFNLGGVAGRSAGSDADARSVPGYPPYEPYIAPMRAGGDVAARLQLRLIEIESSTALLRKWLVDLPPGPVGHALPPGSGEGLAVVEGPRGPIWHWLRLDSGTIGSAFFADPAWQTWPAQEAASVGAAMADLSLIDASFGCARSGVDL